MSIAGIFSSALFGSSTPALQSTMLQTMQQQFQQLGSDLQSGNLSAAQGDFAALQPGGSQPNDITSLAATSSSNQTNQAQGQTHHHHHHGGGGGGGAVSQLMDQLGGDLQTGNLSAAQQAYSSLAQTTSLFGGDTTTASALPGAAADGFSVSA